MKLVELVLVSIGVLAIECIYSNGRVGLVEASAHMRRYVVVWEGGVTVRAYPSQQADVVATLEEGVSCFKFMPGVAKY
jgi:hypothetical protein